MSLKQLGNLANVVSLPEPEDNHQKQEILLSTRKLSKSEMQELEKWMAPAMNSKGMLALNGKENLNKPINELSDYEMILIDISRSDNMNWLSYNIDEIHQNEDKYNTTLVYSKWQSDMEFVKEIRPDFQVRRVPVRCSSKEMFYRMLHSHYINTVKNGWFSALKRFLAFLFGRPSKSQ